MGALLRSCVEGARVQAPYCFSRTCQPGIVDLPQVSIAIGAFLLGGAVKGIVGLGLPTVVLAVLGTALGLREALLLLVAPAFLTNIWQETTAKPEGRGCQAEVRLRRSLGRTRLARTGCRHGPGRLRAEPEADAIASVTVTAPGSIRSAECPPWARAASRRRVAS